MTDHLMSDDDPRLRDAIERLPDEIPPGRDLWPGIRAQLEAERVVALPTAPTAPTAPEAAAAPQRGRRVSLPVGWVAAAAAVLVLATATVTWRLRDPAPPPVAQERPEPLSDGLVTFASYERSAAELTLLLEQRAERLEPATRAVLERSLRTIDEALQEARDALARDPASPGGRAFVEAAWRQKIDFLRRANAVAALREG
ncbi:MAG: hypothetical protein JNL44_03590 [Gemmatimonadetes bacterium]|nr:hypothetical protein [Gemmatimonadota bacterium]